MCGIFGYIASNQEKNSAHICLEGLKLLEYRGYDSAGIAGVCDGNISAFKTTGRVTDLENLLKKKPPRFSLAIAHTRWATHGEPTCFNAHPHLDHLKQLAIVHNGIIENYQELKRFLIEKGIRFESDTDTEVIAQLLGYFYDGNLLETLQKVLPLLQGSWAIGLIHKDFPDEIYAASKEAPLVVGFNPATKELFLSSDPNALGSNLLQIVYLKKNEIVLLKEGQIKIFDLLGNRLALEIETWNVENLDTSKGGFEHFMLKEIYEQPLSLRKACEGRLNEFFGTAHFEELTLPIHELQSIQNIVIIGCGTSYHAGIIASMMLESIAKISSKVAIASEFRYSTPILSENTLVIAISQSGETADTLAAVEEAKKKKCKIIGICNVKHSKLSRESDSCLLLNAGPEISVCSTKAFTSQIAVLSLFTLFLARLKSLEKEEGQQILYHLKRLPILIETILSQASKIELLAKKYSHFKHFIFIGRQYMYITSLEAALKLKEISYAHASGYPAGELKHGPIALIDPSLPTIALCGNQSTYSKLISNLMEIKARKGPILAFADEHCHEVQKACDDFILLPSCPDFLSSIPYSIATQLFAYYIAKQRGSDIDKPRNLAKSVTVE